MICEQGESCIKSSVNHTDTHNQVGRQVAQSVERRTLQVEVQGSKPALGTWWLGWISPNQPYPKGAAPEATTPLKQWWLQISLNGIDTVIKKKTSYLLGTLIQSRQG